MPSDIRRRSGGRGSVGRCLTVVASGDHAPGEWNNGQAKYGTLVASSRRPTVESGDRQNYRRDVDMDVGGVAVASRRPSTKHIAS